MNLPQLPLGVRVMDEDHFVLEQMFARTAEIDDSGLPAHLDAILAEIAAHFLREEAEMERVGVPILHCHRGQHAALLAEGEKLRQAFPGANARGQRRLIVFNLAQLVANHVASVDQISSAFFDKKVDYSKAECVEA
ncbi:hemerythrin domain-containing protein [Rhodoblastus sp.]|uniref:bacteriohemerythrin n=1 Tax=Rhodoblastus sp. TaxID=1962975 RepID=UPI00261175A6|nr:hemerythrin domain-containing protein [Rhodoblastus sp.]